MTDDGLLARAVELLRQSAQPTRIVLFGSWARGDARPDSDMDLLVVVPEVRNRAAEMVRLYRVLSPLRLPVDLLVVSEETFRYWVDTPGNVYSTALAEGRVLYEQAA
jgi:predicted nucleotidyltransferase